MEPDRVVFSTVKVHRGWYFVEYAPPVRDTPFATLSLTTLEDRGAPAVASAMETELDEWLMRYPVPIMVSAFNDTGDLLLLVPARPSDHLIGWRDTESDAVARHWRTVPSTDWPQLDLSSPRLRRLYHDIPFRTKTDLRSGSKAHRRMSRTGTALVFLLFVVAPLPGAGDSDRNRRSLLRA